MRGGHGLSCGAGSGFRVFLFRIAGSGMGSERCLAYVFHPEQACLCPGAAPFDCFTGPVIPRISFLEKRKDMLSAVSCPERQSLVVRLGFELCHSLPHAIGQRGQFKIFFGLHSLTTAFPVSPKRRTAPTYVYVYNLRNILECRHIKEPQTSSEGAKAGFET